MAMRVTKTTRYFCGLILCLGLLLNGFIPESMALWSRITHKSRQTLNGYEIQTPFVWGISEHRDSFNLWKKAGYVRSYLFNPASELIGFYIVPPRKNPVDYQNAIHSLKVAHESIRKIEEHSVAGTKMMCIQSSLPESPLILDVVCVPDGSMGGISVSYTGNAEHVPEFFAILDGVKKTN